MSELTGKRALVTGASSGIGAAIANELAARGVDLVLTGRRRDALDAVAAACIARGARADTITTDLGVPGAASALWTAARAVAPIDILINNAGFGYFRPFSAVDWKRDAELLQLNITSLVELSRRFLDDRGGDPARGRAYLVNIASIGAYQSVPHMAVYAASKAFVRNFTEALHDELRGSPISATCVCPGGTRTGFHAAAGAGDYSWIANSSMMSAQAVARITVDAMRKGKRNVVPGVANKLACWSVRLVSRRIASWMSGLVLGKPKRAELPSRTAA
ncbi:MAG TPA: SDR family oxidoreductase [Kofleriaceae bacterium]|nr:SDR family oxidoreductase [Kofleriaceae bacterium]